MADDPLRITRDNGVLEEFARADEWGRLRFVPHDFRRIFITDAVLHGMPPHIAQLVAGHRARIRTRCAVAAVTASNAVTPK